MELKFKKLSANAVLPRYSNTGDSGIDLRATSRTIGLHYVEYSFGVAIEIPVGFTGLLIPRSSISNTNLYLANSVGVIDSNYRGEIKARFKRDGGSPSFPSVGDRLVQLVVIPIPTIEPIWTDTLEDTIRGIEGFGSTGK